MNKVVVTGSAGFVGGHVAARLRDEGWSVTGFDARPTEIPGVVSVVGDLRDREAVLRAIDGHDAIAHIGAIGDVYLAAEQPDLAAAVNVAGTAHVAQAAVQAGAKVVYASTWEVYGDPEYQPIDEAHPTAPDHPYNVTKLAGEQLLLAAGRLQSLPVVSLRLGTAYGPGLRPNSVFRIFIDRARAGEPITIQGDGSQGRQFTHVSDIAEGFVTALRGQPASTVYNLVADRMVSIKELAEIVVDRFPTELTFGAPRPGDIAPAFVSNERAKRELGWAPTMAFERGIDELIASL